MDLCTVKRDFGHLVENVHPWILSHFVMWLDIKVAEYKINGLMLLDSTPNDTPKWLRQTLHGFKRVDNAEKTHDNQQLSELATEDSRPGRKSVNQRQILEPQEYKKSSETQKLRQIATGPRHLQGFEKGGRNQTPQELMKIQNEQIASERHLSLESINDASYGLQQKQYTRIVPAVDSNLKTTSHRTEKGSDSLQGSKHNKNLLRSVQGNLGVYSPFQVRQGSNHNSLENNPSLQEQEFSSNIYKQYAGKGTFFHSSQENELLRSKVKIEISSDDEGDSSINADQSELQTYADDLDCTTDASLTNQVTEWQDKEREMPHPVKLVPVLKFENDLMNRHADTALMPSGTEGQSVDENAVHNPDLITSLHNNNPIQHSHKLQHVIPFPERFPIENIQFGTKAQEMIITGEITRAAKMQFLEAIFNELVKYTGLYPTPTQKMSVAKAIVETFTSLAGTCRDSNESPADSWYVTLNDKFRNERRGLVHGEVTRKGKLAKRLHASAAFNKVQTKAQRLSDSDNNAADYIGMDSFGKMDQIPGFDDRVDVDFSPNSKCTWTLEENTVIRDFEIMTGQHDMLSTFQNKWSSLCESIIAAAEHTEVPSVQHILQVFQAQTTLTRDEMSALCLYLLCELLLTTQTAPHQSNSCAYLIDFDQGPLSSEELLTDRTNAYIQVLGPLKQISKISIQKENHEIVPILSGIDHAVLTLVAVFHNLALPMPDNVKIPLTFLKQFVLGFCDKSNLPIQVYQFAQRFNLL